MSKKKIILMITALVVMISAVSAISYSIAIKGIKDFSENDVALGDSPSTATVAEYRTNIDTIIEASNAGTSFNIVQIVPSTFSNASVYTDVDSLKNYVSYTDSNSVKIEYFKDLVFDANKSKTTQTMASDKINVTTLAIDSTTTFDTVKDILNAADLIYVSSPTYNAYNGLMTEDVYNFLHTYAVGKNKPIIMDYVRSTDTSVITGSTSGLTYKSLVGEIRTNWKKYKTFRWPDGQTALSFFQSEGNSYFLKYRGISNMDADGNAPVLVISDSPDEATTMNARMKKETASTLIGKAYYTAATLPTDFHYEYKTPDDLNTEFETDNTILDNYDFILLEKDLISNDKAISYNVYAKLKAMSEASKFILLDYPDGIYSDDTTNYSASNNYLKLMSLVITTTGVARQSNVLSVRYGFFTSLFNAGTESAESAKYIAKIIDSGTYRDGTGGGSVDRKFRVLEIEPCYPVDIEVAKKITSGATVYKDVGTYYTYPDQVLYGMSEDEVAHDGSQEYYAFGITKTKIAHATHVPYDQIEIDQVSVDQLISEKPVIKENYDMVFIGGDSSAYPSFDMWKYDPSGDVAQLTEGGSLDSNNSITFDGSVGGGTKLKNYMNQFTSFDMYSHSGKFANYVSAPHQDMGTPIYQTSGNNVVEYFGYDLSTIKRDELYDYVDSGLPVFIDQTVADAFLESYQFDPNNDKSTDKNRLKQLALKNIDPDSNMYQFLTYAYKSYLDNLQTGSTASNGNVSFGEFSWNKYAKDVGIPVIDAAGTTIKKVKYQSGESGYPVYTDTADNSERLYGDSATVTVFNEDVEKEIRRLYDAEDIENTVTRPVLTLGNHPAIYVDGDDSTCNVIYQDGDEDKLKGRYAKYTKYKADASGVVTLDFSKASAPGCTISLYIDKNKDGVFSKDELQNGDTYSFKMDEAGLITWKLVAINDNNNNLADSFTGCSYFAVVGVQKNIRVLQIMPIEDNENAIKTIGLYFCTECQLTRKRLANNLKITSNGSNGYYLDTEMGELDAGGFDYNDQHIMSGKHQHNFGIVKYDSAAILDDWEDNFADVITKGPTGSEDYVAKNPHNGKEYQGGEYKVDLEILTVSELNNLAAAMPDDVDADVTYTATDENDNVLYHTDSYGNYIDVDKDNKTPDEMRMTASELSAYYKGLYDKILSNANAAAAVSGGLDDLMFKFAENIGTTQTKWGSFDQHHAYVIAKGIGTKAAPGDWILNHRYYKLFEFYNGQGNNLNLGIDTSKFSLFKDPDDPSYICDFAKLVAEYNKYTTEHDRALTFLDKSREWGKKAYNSKDWLKGNYDMVILGMADKFNYKDLNQAACDQIKSYISAGGSFLNTHDTMSQGENSSKTMTLALRETFGMDTYRTTEVNEDWDSDGTAPAGPAVTKAAETNYYMRIGWTAEEYSIGNHDLNINLVQDNSGTYSFNNKNYNINVEEGPQLAEDVTEVKVTVSFTDTSGNPYTSVGTQVFFGTEMWNDNIGVKKDVDSNGGVAEFTFTRSFDTSSGSSSGVYYRYKEAGTTPNRRTNDTTRTSNPRYFWTFRYQATNKSELSKALGKVNTYPNAPVGLTYAFACGLDSGTNYLSNFRYAVLSWERTQSGNVNGTTYEAKYGTRRAVQVNKGGVTSYPFGIADVLYISATHPQVYTLDMEDPTVAVWYTLGANYKSDAPEVGADEARQTSSILAASPKDGANSYFLYSKENVFYTGAGNQLITGAQKDNNDERRLFINVIVSSASKGKKKPSLKLYNQSTNTEDDEDGWVNPNDTETNLLLSAELEKLFYNENLGMYQYNIDETEMTDTIPESDDKTYYAPEFDFRAIAGDNSIAKIEVFYDLNYLSANSEKYESNVDKLIKMYDSTSDGVREKLRTTDNDIKKALELKEEYFDSKREAYMVVVVTDSQGQIASARVKLHKLPTLFDLTDATYDYQNQGLTVQRFIVDVTDRRKFEV